MPAKPAPKRTTAAKKPTAAAKKPAAKKPASAAKKPASATRKPAAKKPAAATRKPAAKPASADSAAASKNITKRIQELGDWRGETLARLRQLIHDVVPDVVEEWKWRGVPVWSHDGGICTGESYKEVVKLTFYRGAALPDPQKLFNSSLEGNVRRAIDVRQDAKLDEAAFKALIRAAAAANTAARAPKKK